MILSKTNQEFWKKIIAVVLAITLAVPTVFAVIPAPQAQADTSSCIASYGVAIGQSIAAAIAAAVTSVPATDSGSKPSNAFSAGNNYSSFVTNCIEHGLALSIGRMLLDEMTNQIVDYINSGFQGSPAFVGNPGKYFSNIADQITATALQGIAYGALGINICSPFQVEILAGLEVNFETGNGGDIYQQPYDGCTLEQMGINVQNAVSQFSNWQTFMAVSLNNDSNPYGEFLTASNNLVAKINTQVNINASELNWGNGFLSQVNCQHIEYDKNGNPVTYNYIAPGGNGISVSASASAGTTPPPPSAGPSSIPIAKNSKGKEIYSSPNDKCTITTPGDTIAGVLNTQLGIPAQQLGVANDLDQIFNALFNQLLTTGLGALGLGGGGLGGGGGAPTDWAAINANAAANVTAAGNTANNQENQINSLNNSATNSGNSGTSGNGTINSNNTTNIALNAAVTASPGSAPNYDPKHLTDGNTDMGDSSGATQFGGSITEPNNAIGSFTIDLGQQVNNLFKIVIYPHNPSRNWYVSPSGAAPNFKVLIEDQNHTVVWDSSTNNKPMSTFGSNPYTLILNQLANGRYIVIQGLQVGSLEIAEVQAYQDNGPTITLTGNQFVQATVGDLLSSYDTGATAVDALGMSTPVTVNYTDSSGNPVDPNTPISSGQNYTITYSATDSYGLSNSVTRSIQTTYTPTTSTSSLPLPPS